MLLKPLPAYPFRFLSTLRSLARNNSTRPRHARSSMARRAGSGSFEDQPNYWSKLRSAHHATKGLQLDEEEHDDEGDPLDDERTLCGVRLPSWCGGGAARACRPGCRRPRHWRS